MIPLIPTEYGIFSVRTEDDAVIVFWTDNGGCLLRALKFEVGRETKSYADAISSFIKSSPKDFSDFFFDEIGRRKPRNNCIPRGNAERLYGLVSAPISA